MSPSHLHQLLCAAPIILWALAPHQRRCSSQHIPYNHINCATDPVDMSIAQGLLQTGEVSNVWLGDYQKIDFRPGSPRILQRRSSFSHATGAQQPQLSVDNDNQLANARPCPDRRSRQGISSSTWTSSSGEASEKDDRTPIGNEHNRLTKKVCLNHWG